jgi:hypothetical protein
MNGTTFRAPPCILYYIILYYIILCSTEVKVLHLKSEGRWFDPRWCHGILIDRFFRSHYGLGVDSVYNRNEYQEYFLGVNAAGA